MTKRIRIARAAILVALTIAFSFLGMSITPSAYASSGATASLQATAPLDMTGNWKLTYSNLAGCCTRTYNVHFDKTTANSSNGFHYTGYYKPGGDPHSPLLEITYTYTNTYSKTPLVAETFYGDRGQTVVQLMEHVVDSSGGYFSLLSGYHVPGKLEIQGVWANINQDRGTFTLVKVP